MTLITYLIHELEYFIQSKYYEPYFMIIVESRLSFYHPVRLMKWVSFFIFAVWVPFAYIRIFYWRWNHKTPGISETERIFRRRRNVATMWYNMCIWALEFTLGVIYVSIIDNVFRLNLFFFR